MDASAHKLHTIGVTDNAGDTPESVRANVVTAEQRALNQLFGLNLPVTTNPEVGQVISQRIFSIVRGVYTSLDQAGLQTLITDRVNAALRDVQPRGTLALNDLRRIQAVSKAAYEAIPNDLLERFAEAALPVRISMDRQGRETGRVNVRNLVFAPPSPAAGAPRDITINTDIPFWKLDDQRITDVASLIAGIENRTPAEIGMVGGPWPANHRFTNAEATVIANANDALVMAQPEGTGSRDYEYGPAGANRPKLNVNSDKMMAEFTTGDAPRGLQNRPIYSLSADEIQQLLEHRGKDGSYPYWKKYVTPGTNNPFGDIENLTCNYPGLTPPVVIAPLGAPEAGSYVVSEILRLIHGRPTRADAVGDRVVTLLEVQRDVHRKLDANRALLARFRNGSENPHGAIIAASFALTDPKVLATVSNAEGETKLNKEVSDAQKKILISQNLQKLRDLKISFNLPTMYGVATPANLQLLEAERGNLVADAAAVNSGAGFVSSFGMNGGAGGAPPFAPGPDRRDATVKIQAYQKQVNEEIAKYQEIESLLQVIRKDAVDVDLYSKSGTLRRYITDAAGAVDKTQFTPASLAVDIAEEIKKEMVIESDADLKSKIEKAEASLKKLKAGGETGDQLQQKVFESHFKNQGLSAAEAQKSANYLYSRSLIDKELRDQINALQDDIFEDHENSRSAKDATVTVGIARAVGLTPRVTPGRIPFSRTTDYDWQTLSYPRLISAYYSFKKLYEGGGPAYLNSPGSSVYKGQMRAISNALADRHVSMMINDFGNDLPDKDRAELQSRKTLSLELMEKMLTGEAPAKYGPRIDSILGQVDGNTHRFRRGVLGTANYLGNSTVGTAAYLGKSAVNTAKSVVAGTWNQRKNIATCAALTALGGPLGFALWAGYKAWNAPNIPTSSGGH